MSASHPPLDFPVLGLAERADAPSGPGAPRWLHHVEGRLGHLAEGVWLGHGAMRRDASRPWVQVGTFRREAAFDGAPGVDERARSRALLGVVDATMPDLSRREEGYAHRLLDAATARAEGVPGWRPVEWTVDGRVVPASALDWAGAWAAWTTALPEVYVVAYGAGVPPDGLALATVHDGAAYHVDLGAPLTFPTTVEASLAASGLRMDDDLVWPVHPDHEVGA